jgi:hypothetical protein
MLLRDGVLAGVTVLVAGGGEFGGAVRARAAALDAAVDAGDADVLVFDGSRLAGRSRPRR